MRSGDTWIRAIRHTKKGINMSNFISSPSDRKRKKNKIKLECGPMPNLMVALPNTGGALCSTPQSLADAHP